MSAFRWSIHSCIRYISSSLIHGICCQFVPLQVKWTSSGSHQSQTHRRWIQKISSSGWEREGGGESSVMYLFNYTIFLFLHFIGTIETTSDRRTLLTVYKTCSCVSVWLLGDWTFNDIRRRTATSTCGGSVVYLWRLIQIVHSFDSILYIDELKCQRRCEQKLNERIHDDQIHSMNMISHWRDVVMTISLHSIQFQWYLPLNLCQYLSLHRSEVRERTKQKKIKGSNAMGIDKSHTHSLTFIYLFVSLHSIVHIRNSKLMEKVSSIRERIKRQWSLSSSSF